MNLLPNIPTTIAYVIFRDPLPLDTYWLLLLPPLALAIAVVYKAIKIDDLAHLPQQAIWLTFEIVGFMVLAAAAFWLIADLV